MLRKVMTLASVDRRQSLIGLIGVLMVVGPVWGADTATPVQIFSVAWGDKAGQLGYKAHIERHEDLGPKSFFVANGDEIYVLDNVNRRLNVYDFHGELTREIPWSRAYPKDIYVLDGVVYVLTNFSVEMLSPSGALTKSISVAGAQESPLGYRVWKLFGLAGMLVVSEGRGRSNKIACYQPQTLERKPCSKIERLFEKYEVIESTGHEAIIAVNGGIDTINLDSGEKSPIGESPYNLVDQGLFEMTTFFKVAGGKLYTMEPSKAGASFYVRCIGTNPDLRKLDKN